MEALLEKSRRINKILQKTAGQHVDFKDVAEVLKNVIAANVYIVDRSGKILGISAIDEFNGEMLSEGDTLPADYNGQLLSYDESKVNLQHDETDALFKDNTTTIIPILGGGKRLGTLLLARNGKDFRSEDLVLAEYGATVIGMEVLRIRADKIEEEARNKAVVQMAIGTLSYSELEAVENIFAELNGDEGILVASKIADQLGITRSVIVNALRKFESAGVIQSRSLGMKGTYIKVKNPYLLEQIEKRNAVAM
ncbi:MAG TPA: GTP-sensing pleiotropic transcriptional regulator CodY [Oscillospiraceae bacterium]|nr:GTP-sensing pleiotropic transcriptional regulator CodY [Oscillospiraceae bacterium]